MRRALFALLLAATLSAAAADKTAIIKNVSRSFGSAGGGTVLTLSGNNLLPTVQCLLPCPTTVTFGDKPAVVKSELATALQVVTPPHAAGTVDIIVSIAGEAPITLVGAFTYDESLEANFVRVLLPVYFDGILKGAYGSEWATSLWIRNNGEEAVHLAPWSCSDGAECGSNPSTFALSPNRSLRGLAPAESIGGNPSRLLYVSQDGAADVSFNLHFADQSRGAVDAGIDIPVIRDDEALAGTAQLFNVPVRPAYRALMRLYEMGDVASSRFRVTIYPQSDADVAPLVTQELTITRPQGSFAAQAGFAQLDVTGLLQASNGSPDTVRVEITPLTEGSRYWSFVSLTNNDTQIVTLVTPQ